MRQPRIAVVGSANVDLITFTDEIPRPGETLFGREFNMGFGGKGANQAVAARLCGAEVSMVGRVGEDQFGPATIENFVSRGIDSSHVLITPGFPSGVAPIFVDSAGQNRILVVKGANDRVSPVDVDAAADLLMRADFIVLQLEIPLETVFHTLRFARANGHVSPVRTSRQARHPRGSPFPAAKGIRQQLIETPEHLWSETSATFDSPHTLIRRGTYSPSAGSTIS